MASFTLQGQLQTFMDEKFVTITTTQPALHMLLRFQRWAGLSSGWGCWHFITRRLRIPKLNIEGRFHQIIQMYTSDLELVQKMYMKDRRDPPLPRDLPPISGDLYFLRQFYYIHNYYRKNCMGTTTISTHSCTNGCIPTVWCIIEVTWCH